VLAIQPTLSMQTDLNPNSVNSRMQSVDFVRGLVMVLMAIDHVRVYAGQPAGGPEPGIFFSRWVTHFCAPVFVFLSGASAYLYGSKLNDPTKLMRYLLSRGVLFILLEFTFIRFCWTFNFNYNEFILAGVIWMLGWCMILLACMVRLSAKWIGIMGVLIIFLQNVFGYVPNLLPEAARVGFGRVWEFIYTSGLEGPPGITILYVLVPWIGVMMTGYGFGILLQRDEASRKKILIQLGLVTTLAFLVAGTVKIFVSEPSEMPFLFALLNQNKYPASQLYLLMTLGPAILLMAFVEKSRGLFAEAMIIFGRVPFFYYLLHIPLIHISALIVQIFWNGAMHQEWYATAPYTWQPEENRWDLWLLYLVFVLDVVILFFACRWYQAYKLNHPEKNWLKYL
jgi:uncharacterized membrane protein